MKNIRIIIKWAVILLIIAFPVIQLFPVERKNPPIETVLPAADDVRSVLRQSCYDCHSNETVWPWYSRIAPISWIIASDVREGRAELNFSTWNRYDQKRHAKLMKEIWEEVAEGKMPPWMYLAAHPDARLSQSDRAVLRAWSLSAAQSSRTEN